MRHRLEKADENLIACVRGPARYCAAYAGIMLCDGSAATRSA